MTNAPAKSKKILVFDLDVSGHHASYLEHIVNYALSNLPTYTIYFLVSSDFISILSKSNGCDIVDSSNVHFITLSSQELRHLKKRSFLFNRYILPFQIWNIMCRHADDLQITHCLVMYLDSLMLPAFLYRKTDFDLSAIYFRPLAHYKCFPNFSPSVREICWLCKDWFFQLFLFKSNHFTNLFCLDSFAVHCMKKYNSCVNSIHLPDPVKNFPPSQSEMDTLKKSLNLEEDRRVFLLFGTISDHKGIHQLLEAILLLPTVMADKMCILIVGPLVSVNQNKLDEGLAKISTSSSAKIIQVHRHIYDHEIKPYFDISDVILAPYQRHVGMSSILVRAALSRKPVISSNFGLMGHLTREFELGLTVDSTSPSSISSALEKMITISPQSFINPEKASNFAVVNSPERYCKTLFRHI